jgi:transglutaminase-like putative cysteine protease
MKRYTVRHETHYRYSLPVDLGLHQLRLTPVSGPRQTLVAHSIAIAPQPDRLSQFEDHFGNRVHGATIESRHTEFSVILEATIDVPDAAPAAVPEGPAPDGPLPGGPFPGGPFPGGPFPDGPPWESIAAAMQGDGFPTPPEVAEFTYASPLAQASSAATDYVRESFTSNIGIVAALRHLLARMHADFAYTPGVTDVTTAVDQVMESRAGVCQDFAHVMIAGLRGLGLPARYVSGYLRTYPAPQSADSPPALQGADASHAWVSVWCGPEICWLECDPTNNLVVGDEHIAVAYGRDFSDVTPLRGVILGGGQHTLSVAVTVEPRALD